MRTRFFEKIITSLFDIIAINVALAATFWLRFQSNLFPETYNPSINLIEYFFPGVILTIGWLILFFFTGLYRDWYKESRLDEFFVVTRTIIIGTSLLFLLVNADEIMLFVKTGHHPVLLSRTQFGTLLTYFLCILMSATINRFAMHTLLNMVFSRGIGVENVVIIGASQSGEQLRREIGKYPNLGYTVIGFIDNDGRKKGQQCVGLPIFGIYSDLPDLIKKHSIRGLIISHISTSANEIMRILNYCSDSSVSIYMVPSLMDVISGHLKTHQVFGVPLIVILKDHMPIWQAQIKRLFDVISAISVLTLGSPLWLFLAWLIRKTSPGPAVYKQERIGQYGKPFIMMKFRSMYQDAEKRSGPAWATENDPRITPLGRILRKTRLDEIPQFINVLKGEMSLVGPRPERAFFIEKLKEEIPWYIRRIKMKPGITGWAQVKHKYDASIEDVKKKVIYDLYYFENMSLLLDIKIILRTIIVALTGKGAH
ncbi:MAG: sugar transferase [Chitinivibrionales bacterium]|nr:sugar transferase [Chitinivibrionales bacterium]